MNRPAIALPRPSAPPGWTAILLAGDRPGGDPLAGACGVRSKALIRVAGMSMLRRVAGTLLAVPAIGRVVILAQDPDALMTGDAAGLQAHPRVELARSGAGIAASIAAVAGSEIAPWPVLVTTADNVLLTPRLVQEFLAGAPEFDISVGLGERRLVERRYPETRRTWLKFSDGHFSGANLFALRGGSARGALALWSRVEQDRKKVWKLVAHFGLWLFLRMLFRTLGLRAALWRAGTRLGVRVHPVVLSAPEAVIDVDKAADLDLAEAILTGPVVNFPAPLPGREAEMEGRPRRIAVYDLDRTLTVRPTYSAFLLRSALHVAPLRLLLAPLAGLAMLAYGLKLFSRDRLKAIMWSLLLGKADPRRLERAVAAFTRRTLRSNIRPGAREQIARDRAAGAMLVLATAAHELYAGPIASGLGFDTVVATRVAVGEDGRVGPSLAGGNVYGEGKRAALADFLRSLAVPRGEVALSFYSDSSSDRSVLEWSDRPVAVNPSRRLRRLAAEKGWAVRDWGRP